jgi:hypothetical protein
MSRIKEAELLPAALRQYGTLLDLNRNERTLGRKSDTREPAIGVKTHWFR